MGFAPLSPLTDFCYCLLSFDHLVRPNFSATSTVVRKNRRPPFDQAQNERLNT
jgi:hypothetical protein